MRCVWMALAVEQDEPAASAAARGEQTHALPRGLHGPGTRRFACAHRPSQEIHSRLGQDDLHDGFAVAGAGSAAGFGVGVTAAADERRITDTAGELAAGAAGGSAGEKTGIAVKGHGADGAVFMAAMVRGGVFVAAAFL